MSEAVRLAVMRCAARREAERKKKKELLAAKAQKSKPKAKLKPSPVVFGSFSRQCQDHPHPNEDRVIMSDLRAMRRKIGLATEDDGEANLFAVCDGHGGSETVEFVKNNLPQALARNDHFGKDWCRALSESYLQVDSTLLAAKNAKISGACVLVAIITETRLFVANAGDCRAVLLPSDQDHVLQITVDHKASNAHEKARITEAGGFVANNRVFGLLAVSRALGDFELKRIPDVVLAEPDTFELVRPANGKSLLVMGSDGIWDVSCNDDVIETALRKLSKLGDKIDKPLTLGRRCELAAVKIVKEAVRRGSRDDCTAMVIVL